MPWNEGKTATLGVALVEFASREDAEKALATLNGWNMDATHKLAVCRLEDFKREVAEATGPLPDAIAAEAVGAGDELAWLMDETARDQFLTVWEGVAHDKHQEVNWCDGKRPPAVEFAGHSDPASIAAQAWTGAGAARWSPQGSYLVTMAGRGARLWSGPSFHYGHGLRHDGINAVVWSPNERYLYTWSGFAGNKTPDRAIIVWDARTGREIRTFKQRYPTDDAPDMVWSADGNLLARLKWDDVAGVDLVKVYEMPAGTLLDSRSIKAPCAVDISFAPRGGNLLAWWSPEVGDSPAGVQVMRLPSRELVRQRNLYNVDRVDMVWHPDGTHLAVLAARTAKKKKKTDKPARGE